MMRQTACDGVVVGRGCLGRPWLFRDLAAVFHGQAVPPQPNFGEVIDTMLEHAESLVQWLGEPRAMRNFRKHTTWYTKGFPGSARLRQSITHANDLASLRAGLQHVDRSIPFPESALRVPRGKSAGTQRVALPDGYLEHRDDATPPCAAAEDPVSGG